jgi:hypothetical protein
VRLVGAGMRHGVLLGKVRLNLSGESFVRGRWIGDVNARISFKDVMDVASVGK